MTPCMGGWCGLREKCPHHTTPFNREPSERLCIKGEDGWQLAENASRNASKRPVFPVKVEKRLPSEVAA